MALRYLLDTNICICIAKQRPPAAAKRFKRLAAGTVGMSLIAFGELRYGAEKSAQRDEAFATLERLVELIPVLGVIADRYPLGSGTTIVESSLFPHSAQDAT
jgi:tRNA(fMet)-specific endonuclease VapC